MTKCYFCGENIMDDFEWWKGNEEKVYAHIECKKYVDWERKKKKLKRFIK